MFVRLVVRLRSPLHVTRQPLVHMVTHCTTEPTVTCHRNELVLLILLWSKAYCPISTSSSGVGHTVEPEQRPGQAETCRIVVHKTFKLYNGLCRNRSKDTFYLKTSSALVSRTALTFDSMCAVHPCCVRGTPPNPKRMSTLCLLEGA